MKLLFGKRLEDGGGETKGGRRNRVEEKSMMF